jgi:hypothetical protein
MMGRTHSRAVLTMVLTVVVAIAACSSSPDRASVSSAPVPTTQSAPGPCRANALGLTPRDAGLGAGTSTLTVVVQLIDGPSCLVLSSPDVALIDAAGTVIAQGAATSENGSAELVPGRPLSFDLAWTSWCLATPPRPLVAEIGFNPGDKSRLVTPATFEDGPCRDEPTNVSVDRNP